LRAVKKHSEKQACAKTTDMQATLPAIAPIFINIYVIEQKKLRTIVIGLLYFIFKINKIIFFLIYVRGAISHG